MVEEGRLDLEVRAQRTGTGHDLADTAGGARVAAAVCDGDQGGRAHEWIPHSVLPLPAHRPLRGSSPGATLRVQGQHPIDG